MIWLVLAVMLAGGLIFLCAPLYHQQAPAIHVSSEIEDYKAQIANLEARIAVDDSPEELTRTKLELQRQLIKRTREDGASSRPSKPLLISLLAAFGIATIGLYSQIGAPELTKVRDQVEADMPLDQLVERLEVKLRENPTDPNGWLLYARSLMTLGQYDEAGNAYRRVLVLTDNNADVAQEFQNASDFIVQKQGRKPAGPTAADIQAASQMSREDRLSMVQGMVDGLSAKLLESPEDPDGWARLLRARNVLGQETEALAEIERMKLAFEDQPDTIKAILAASGLAPEE